MTGRKAWVIDRVASEPLLILLSIYHGMDYKQEIKAGESYKIGADAVQKQLAV